jgi:Tfp pilus assembly protein PilV
MEMGRKLILKKRLCNLSQAGFSLVEVMISAALLTMASLALLSVFGLAIAANQSSQQDLIARQLASDAMESIFTARNTSQLSFSQIQNVSNGGIFADGPQSLLCAGPTYGIIGVAGDTSQCKTATGATCPNGGVQCLNEPGPDGIVGTADDVILSLANYTRTIAITPLTSGSPPTTIQTLVQVTVTITYSVPSYPVPKNYTLVEYVSEYY